MKIVDAEVWFTLVAVQKNTKEDGVFIELDFDQDSFFVRDFNPKNCKKYKLKIFGIKDEAKFITKVRKYEGSSYISVDEEDGKLVFCHDAYDEIGEFEFERYEEEITDFQIEDWISEYERLVKYFYESLDRHSKESVVKRKFIDNLTVFLNKEIDNAEKKNAFLGDQAKHLESKKLAEKVLVFIAQHERAEDDIR